MKKQYKENFTKLAKALLKIEQKVFSMRYYRADSNGERVDYFNKNDCGTVGSALGWSPFVKGLEPIEEDFYKYAYEKPPIWFAEYSCRLFGTEESSNWWEWCFHRNWYDTDNTPVGASKRIMELVNNGLPDNWVEQVNGYEPYMFAEAKDEQV